MTIAASPEIATPTDIATNMAASVAVALNGLLADTFALYFKTKNFHWHVSGPHFRDYHLLLDEQSAQLIASTDTVAERVRKIGSTTLRSIGDVTRHQSISDDDRPFVEPKEMLAELLADNRTLVEALRHAKRLADDAGDNATSSLIDELTDQAEGRAWFLFEAGRA